MKHRKLLSISIILLLGITYIFPNVYAVQLDDDTIYLLDTTESHLIEGVPYVGQETNFYCFYASVTMILQYYGVNTTLKEVLHHSGIGYSLFYNSWYNLVKNKPIFSEPSYFRYPLPGYVLCQLTPNELASIFNLTSNYWFPDKNKCSIELNWEEYWSKVKENITNNIPVMTSVNTSYLPYTDISAGHAIVIVGFNQTHIFYNDPATALFSNPEDGFYANMSIDVFQKTVNLTPATKFLILTFSNTSNISYNRTEIFKKAYERNIKRLKGFFITEDYSSINFGINAIRLLRNDFRVGPFYRMLTIYRYWDLINKNGSLYSLFKIISIERLNASQYLLENKELSQEICLYAGSLLENESKHWMNIANYIQDFQRIANEHGYLITSILSLHITIKIKSELNKIISIEKAIIHDSLDGIF